MCVCLHVYCREQYSEILRKRWVEVFNQIFDEDNYTAISVETPEEYQRVASVYPFKDASLEQVLPVKHTRILHYTASVWFT